MWKSFIQKVHPAPIFSTPATSNTIMEAENALNIELPVELKELLLETNGVTEVYGLDIVWSIERVKKENLSMRSNAEFQKIYMPFDHLFFFAGAGNGDLFAYTIIAGKIRPNSIFAWNHEDDSRTWVAPSLEKYLEWWLGGKINL